MAGEQSESTPRAEAMALIESEMKRLQGKWSPSKGSRTQKKAWLKDAKAILNSEYWLKVNPDARKQVTDILQQRLSETQLGQFHVHAKSILQKMGEDQETSYRYILVDVEPAQSALSRLKTMARSAQQAKDLAETDFFGNVRRANKPKKPQSLSEEDVRAKCQSILTFQRLAYQNMMAYKGFIKDLAAVAQSKHSSILKQQVKASPDVRGYLYELCHQTDDVLTGELNKMYLSDDGKHEDVQQKIIAMINQVKEVILKQVDTQRVSVPKQLTGFNTKNPDASSSNNLTG